MHGYTEGAVCEIIRKKIQETPNGRNTILEGALPPWIQIEVWNMAAKPKTGTKITREIIKRMLRKAKTTDQLSCTVDQYQ